jgi:tRNA (guanine37-N1)-methyltransferase
MIDPIINASILKRAQDQGAVDIQVINFRDYSQNKHQTVDDTPYGGGAGMVLSVEPIYHALNSIDHIEQAHIILLSPQGQVYKQEKAKALSKHEHIVLICGHYEGFDERIRSLVHEEISIGDYVLTGGEIAAMAIVDSVVRLLPNVLGDEDSYKNDSFYHGLLDYPQYTKPRVFNGMEVPEVLLSGHHQNIDLWRQKASLERTKERRPDLYEKYEKNKKKQ